MAMVKIILANLVIKKGIIKNAVLLSDAKFYKGNEIVKIEIIKDLGEPNKQLTKEEYLKINAINN